MKIERAKRQVQRERLNVPTPQLLSIEEAAPRSFQGNEFAQVSSIIGKNLAYATLQRDLAEQDAMTMRYKQLQAAYIQDIQSLNTSEDISERRKIFNKDVEEIENVLKKRGQLSFEGWEKKVGNVLYDETNAQEQYVRLKLEVKEKHLLIQESIKSKINEDLLSFANKLEKNNLKPDQIKEFLKKQDEEIEKAYKNNDFLGTKVGVIEVKDNGTLIEGKSSREVESMTPNERKHYLQRYRNERDKALVTAGIYGYPGTNSVEFQGRMLGDNANPNMIAKMLMEKDESGDPIYFKGLVGEERLKYFLESSKKAFGAGYGGATTHLKWADFLVLGRNLPPKKQELVKKAYNLGGNNWQKAVATMKQAFSGYGFPDEIFDTFTPMSIFTGNKEFDSTKSLADNAEFRRQRDINAKIIGQINTVFALDLKKEEKDKAGSSLKFDLPYNENGELKGSIIDYVNNYLTKYKKFAPSAEKAFGGQVAGNGIGFAQPLSIMRELRQRIKDSTYYTNDKKLLESYYNSQLQMQIGNIIENITVGDEEVFDKNYANFNQGDYKLVGEIKNFVKNNIGTDNLLDYTDVIAPMLEAAALIQIDSGDQYKNIQQKQDYNSVYKEVTGYVSPVPIKNVENLIQLIGRTARPRNPLYN